MFNSAKLSLPWRQLAILWPACWRLSGPFKNSTHLQGTRRGWPCLEETGKEKRIKVSSSLNNQCSESRIGDERSKIYPHSLPLPLARRNLQLSGSGVRKSITKEPAPVARFEFVPSRRWGAYLGPPRTWWMSSAIKKRSLYSFRYSRYQSTSTRSESKKGLKPAFRENAERVLTIPFFAAFHACSPSIGSALRTSDILLFSISLMHCGWVLMVASAT